jgi:hypothetical protein
VTDARLAGQKNLDDELTKIFDKHGVPATRRRWRAALAKVEDQWTHPDGWENENLKAGDAWNHWYGIFSTTWLDGWLRDNDWEEGDGRKIWEMGVISLRRLSGVLVANCHGVWCAAANVWRDNDKEEEEAARRKARPEQLRREMRKRTGRLAGTSSCVGAGGRGGTIYAVALKEAKQLAGSLRAEIRSRTRRRTRRENELILWEQWTGDALVSWWEGSMPQQL